MKVPHLHRSSVWKEIGRNAYVDWILTLVLSTLTALVLIFAGLYLYWQISSGNFHSSQSGEASSEQRFDESGLNTIIERFEIREDISNEIKRGYRGHADPSL